MVVTKTLVKPFYDGVKAGTMELKDVLNSMCPDGCGMDDENIASYQEAIRSGEVTLDDVVNDINGTFESGEETPTESGKKKFKMSARGKRIAATIGIGFGSAALGTALGFFVGKRVSSK